MAKPVALVTGASVGIGEQFARILAERGHDLVLVARDAAPARRARQGARGRARASVRGAAGRPHRPRSSSRRSKRARRRTVDVLVNNAGFGTFGSFHELDLDAEDRRDPLNVLALVRLTHAAAKGMVERGRGGILNVASIAGYQPTPNDATYAATKAFVISFTRGGPRGAEGHGRRRSSVLVPGLHPHRVPGTRRLRPVELSRSSCGRKPTKSRAPASTASPKNKRGDRSRRRRTASLGRASSNVTPDAHQPPRRPPRRQARLTNPAATNRGYGASSVADRGYAGRCGRRCRRATRTYSSPSASSPNDVTESPLAPSRLLRDERDRPVARGR